MSGVLAGKTAVVTGASRGIGSEIARALAMESVRVALVARTRPNLIALAAEIGGDALVIESDLTAKADVDRTVETIHAEFNGAPDILVNNAGIFQMKSVDETGERIFEEMVELNMVAPFRLIRAMLPSMRTRGSGDIVSIGSVADREIYAGNAAYSATKFGLRAIHEVLREDLRGTGVRATLVSPSGVDTPLWEAVDDSAESRDRTGMLSARSVASAVLFALQQPREVNIYELRLAHS